MKTKNTDPDETTAKALADLLTRDLMAELEAGRCDNARAIASMMGMNIDDLISEYQAANPVKP